jgi:hypothetical protein
MLIVSTMPDLSPANLLVVNPLVAFYNPMSGQSTEILLRTGPTNPRLAEEAQV